MTKSSDRRSENHGCLSLCGQINMFRGLDGHFFSLLVEVDEGKTCPFSIKDNFKWHRMYIKNRIYSLISLHTIKCEFTNRFGTFIQFALHTQIFDAKELVFVN